MQSRCGLACGLVVAALLAMPPGVGALDLPGSPAQVKLKRSPKGKSFQVVFKRPSFFPAIGGSDDPGVGTPGGMLIEVFSMSEGYASVTAPRGAGTPGWTSYPTKNPPRYKFTDSDAPDAFSAVKKITFVSSRVLKVVAKDVALPLLVPQGGVGVRITVGGIRTCARFDAPAIRRDVPGSFTAKIVEGTGLTDCSDASLGGGTCGNAVVEAPEQCDGSSCGGGFTCGTPGTNAECECCNIACGENAFCCPGQQCETQPGPPGPCGNLGICGRCIPTLCKAVSECQFGQACQNGRCCAYPSTQYYGDPPSVCDFYGEYTLPCCAPSICAAGSGLVTCCFPAGESCTDLHECCSSSCTAGHCD